MKALVAPRLRAARRALAVVGLITALVGIGLDDRRVVWIAIGLLGVAAALRLMWARRVRSTQEHP